MAHAGLALPNRLPRFRVHVKEVAPKSRGREEATAPHYDETPLMKWISVDTGEELLRMGTRVGDEYYPSGLLSWDPQAMTRAYPAAEAHLLSEQVDLAATPVASRRHRI